MSTRIYCDFCEEGIHGLPYKMEINVYGTHGPVRASIFFDICNECLKHLQGPQPDSPSQFTPLALASLKPSIHSAITNQIFRGKVGE